jgi:hypothetical protein
MKRSLLTLLLGLLSFGAALHAQAIGLQLATPVPLAKDAYLLKPGFGVEANILSGEIDERWKYSILLGYSRFRPTQDTFRTYVMEYGSTTRLLPGYEVIKKYAIGSAGFGLLCQVLEKKFSPVVGIDGFASLIVINEDYGAEGFITASVTNDSYWQLSLCPKAGISYQLSDNWLLNTGAGISVGFGNAGVMSMLKPYLLIHYFF